jgi:hypothetical protein
MAVMALNGAHDHSRDALALTWLATQQVPDGGFAYQALWGPTSDPDSDAMVLQALMSSLQDPASPAWTKIGKTVVTDLVSLQAPSGGYAGFSGVDAFTTAQVPLALERVPYPVDFTTMRYYVTGNALPGSSAPPASPGATPTGAVVLPVTTATASATPTPTASTRVTLRRQPAAAAATTSTPRPQSTHRPRATPSPTGGVLGLSSTTTGTGGSGPGDNNRSESWWWAYALAAIVGAGGAVAGVLMRRRRSI